MNAAKILHDTAMDFYDMAKIAKAKGNLQSHQEYMQKALVIEKEAALKLPDPDEDTFWPYAYLRSAAWMAFHLEKFEEARVLVQLALAGQPSPFERERLQEIIAALDSAMVETNEAPGLIDRQTITGFLISIDLSERRLIVQLNDKNHQQLAFSPALQIAPYLLGQLVTVELKEFEKGESLVQQIRLAA